MPTIGKIENNLKKLCLNLDPKNFIFDFLLAYEQPKATINRLKKGDYNLSKKDNQVIWKKKLLYETISDKEDVHDKIDDLSKDKIVEKNNIRFVIVTDFKLLLAIDKQTNQTLDTNIEEISNHSDFFLPLIGLEKAETIIENQADIKAAVKMGKLYDFIVKDNEDLLKSDRDRHGLNIFFTRILFCFFAEDSDIFLKGLFTNSISSHTEKDGKDLDIYLKKIFEVLNNKERKGYSEYLDKFPYVNGDLFSNEYKIPKFSKESRKILIESGELDWSSINPDILGSMMQAVVHSGIRQELGMHYTSVENILKIIKPLFLDDLYEEFYSAKNDIKKLKSILNKIYNLIIFDPACGSGNFLVISFKELSKIEIEIFKKLKEIDKNSWLIIKSGINLTQFYGIEKDDYAHEAAKLSLWIAQHQMNSYFKRIFFETRPTLPLSPSGNIVCGDSTILNWDKVCPKNKNKKYYILGNPPYVGSSWQTKEQKSNMVKIFKGISNFKNLDYISCWFFIGSKYISDIDAKLAFVSTNSLTQGEQVGLFWPHIYKLGLEIDFAYKSFKWQNYAKGKAGVTCVIVGLRKLSNKPKFLFYEKLKKKVKNINPYLISTSSNVMLFRTQESISNLPKMVKGNQPTDGGNFILTDQEREKMISEDSRAKKFIKKYIGSNDLIRGKSRWCLWISDEKKNEALSISAIKERIIRVKNFRLKSDTISTNQAASISHKFIQIQHEPCNSIIVPRVSSEKRMYIPIGFVNSEFVISDTATAIYDPPPYVFAIITSLMHMTWVSAVAGRLETRYMYSSTLCYNAFPFPEINQNQKKDLDNKTFNILDQREKYPELTLGELYDSDKIPQNLLKAHQELDVTVDKCYRSNPFKNYDDRLEYLFNAYEKISKKNKLI